MPANKTSSIKLISTITSVTVITQPSFLKISLYDQRVTFPASKAFRHEFLLSLFLSSASSFFKRFISASAFKRAASI